MRGLNDCKSLSQSWGHGSQLVSDLLRRHALQLRAQWSILSSTVIQIWTKTQCPGRVIKANLCKNRKKGRKRTVLFIEQLLCCSAYDHHESTEALSRNYLKKNFATPFYKKCQISRRKIALWMKVYFDGLAENQTETITKSREEAELSMIQRNEHWKTNHSCLFLHIVHPMQYTWTQPSFHTRLSTALTCKSQCLAASTIQRSSWKASTKGTRVHRRANSMLW